MRFPFKRRVKYEKIAASQLSFANNFVVHRREFIFAFNYIFIYFVNNNLLK